MALMVGSVLSEQTNPTLTLRPSQAFLDMLIRTCRQISKNAEKLKHMQGICLDSFLGVRSLM
eukprot:5456911-Amphidinium_carterae.1